MLMIPRARCGRLAALLFVGCVLFPIGFAFWWVGPFVFGGGGCSVGFSSCFLIGGLLLFGDDFAIRRRLPVFCRGITAGMIAFFLLLDGGSLLPLHQILHLLLERLNLAFQWGGGVLSLILLFF